MTRAAICGAALGEAARVLGLEVSFDAPEVALVDLNDEAGVAAAAGVVATVPRVAVGGADHELLLRALGARIALAASAEPAALGPLISQALPPRTRRSSRSLLVSGVGGGSGRTLLAVNLAVRLAQRWTVLLLDATGSGTAAWWLGVEPGPWSDLEGLVDELTADHLAVVAAERGTIRVVGGGTVAPSPALVLAAARAAPALADLVIVDGPTLTDERARSLVALCDRSLLLIRDDPALSLAGLAADGPWIVGSRTRAARLAGHDLLRALPDDARAVSEAIRARAPVGGALGRAYDGLAELIALDVS